MIKFNHNKSGITEAVGLTSDQISELFVQSLDEYRKSREYIPTDTQKVAILVVIAKVIDPQMLSIILEGVGGEEFNAASEVLEYLYRNLSEKTYYELTALCIKNMEE